MPADDESYLVRRREVVSKGEYVSRDEGISVKSSHRETFSEYVVAWEDEREEAKRLIERQAAQNRKRRNIILAAILAAFVFLYAIFQHLVAGWIHEDCKLGIKDFGSIELLKHAFRRKCL